MLPLPVEMREEESAHIDYNFLCALLTQLSVFDGLALTVHIDDLNNTIAEAEAKEDNMSGTAPTVPDMAALWESLPP